MVLVQKWPFFQVFFFAKIGQENFFYDILEPKNDFLGYKIISPKSLEIFIFPKGLTHGFGPKMAIFARFFLGNIRQENVFYNILQPQNYFLGYKKGSPKNSKN